MYVDCMTINTKKSHGNIQSVRTIVGICSSIEPLLKIVSFISITVDNAPVK